MKIKSTIFYSLKMLSMLMSVLCMMAVDSDDWVKPLIGVFVFAVVAFGFYFLEYETR